jgi:ABC-type sugar transport system ATPase subunit
MDVAERLSRVRPHFRSDPANDRFWVIRVDFVMSGICPLKVRAAGNDMKVVELSEGNQQKVVIAKSLVQNPDLIIFDEPTRGVDVVAIHELIQQFADEGKAVVVISSYLPEAALSPIADESLHRSAM